MQNILLFIVPIYCRSPKKHSEDYKKKYAIFIKNEKKIRGDLYEKKIKENPNFSLLAFQNRWYSWKYNQIIGFVEIYYDGGTKIKSDIWKVKGKRFRPIMKKKTFQYKGKLDDVMMIFHDSNDEIRQRIQDYLIRIQKKFKNRYIDTTQTENLLPLIDFCKLIKKCKSKD